MQPRGHIKGLLDFFLQSSCALCYRPTDRELCKNCAKQILNQKLPSSWCWQGELRVFTWGVYGGTLKRAIAALKYENQPQLARPLGDWLAKSWLTLAAAKKLIVVPIPLHIDKYHQRGYNQASLIAESFCHGTRLSLQQMGLKRIRATVAQFRVSAKEREKNLAMAFELGSGFRHQPNYPVLLIDDVYTTGATARSAAKVLIDNGIQVYGLAAIAMPKKLQ